MVRGGACLPLLHSPLLWLSEEAGLPPASALWEAEDVQGAGHIPGGWRTRPGAETKARAQKETRQTEKLQFPAKIKSIFVHLKNKVQIKNNHMYMYVQKCFQSYTVAFIYPYNVFESLSCHCCHLKQAFRAGEKLVD